MTTDKVPVTRPTRDIHPKVAAGGVTGAVTVAAVALFTQYAPDMPPETAASIAASLVWATQTGVAYAKKSWRRRTVS